jgi:hypothetical protein
MGDVKWCFATYVIVSLVPYLSDDGFLLSRNILH